MSEKTLYLDIPGVKSRALLARRQEFVARGVSSAMNVFAAKADGAIIEDVDGNRYIDFAGGIGTMNVGHARPEVTRAIAEQAAKFTHTCFSVMMYEPYVELAERIVKLAPGDFPKKAIFFNRTSCDHHLRQRFSWTHVDDDDDDLQGETLQTSLRPVRSGGIPGAIPI